MSWYININWKKFLKKSIITNWYTACTDRPMLLLVRTQCINDVLLAGLTKFGVFQNSLPNIEFRRKFYPNPRGWLAVLLGQSWIKLAQLCCWHFIFVVRRFIYGVFLFLLDSWSKKPSWKPWVVVMIRKVMFYLRFAMISWTRILMAASLKHG